MCKDEHRPEVARKRRTVSHTCIGGKNSESFTAFKMELQNWAGSPHDNILQFAENAESREGRLTELDIAGDSGTFQGNGPETVASAHFMH